MPKRKTHKGVAKRLKLTARGKLLYRRGGRRHLLSTKSAKRRRHLRKWVLWDNPIYQEKLKTLMPYGAP